MARKTVRSLWADKLAGKLDKPGTVANDRMRDSDSALAERLGIGKRVPFHGLVLGVDPSLRATGLAVVDFTGSREGRLVVTSTVRSKATATMPECLAAIFTAITSLLETYAIRHTAVEQTIFVQNFQTAQILGAARGAALAAAALKQQAIFEYPPLRVKQAVVGFGRASKEQVTKQIRSLLHLPAELPFDEADAVAVALCHALTWRE
ncbi:MAG: crossover junction endodeoxyribonuclease RuvC [Verrucomicrobiota bacterium]|nr:crossover junction endodeoxyribonuclease RuvC [Verrucomicrobiota bacterium]